MQSRIARSIGTMMCFAPVTVTVTGAHFVQERVHFVTLRVEEMISFRAFTCDHMYVQYADPSSGPESHRGCPHSD